MDNYYLGIDVSKGYADFVILDASKKPLAPGFQLDDTAQGHRVLTDYLERFFQDHPGATLYAAVESTGGFENNWYHRLRSLASYLPLHIARLNPAWVKFNSEASARRNKTDAISAQDIALYQIDHPEKIIYDEQDYPKLRRLWSYIRMLVKQQSQLLNQLNSQLYSTMPELLTFTRNGVPKWLLKLLEVYPSYQKILQAGVAGLEKIPYIPQKKARRIIALVEKGVGGESDVVSEQVISSLATQILHLEKLIQQQKRFLEKNYSEARQQIDLLVSFIGIGIYSAVGLLLNIGNIQRFPSVKHLASYFGVHPVYRISGDGRGGVHMSKQGRSEGRAILYMIAFSAIRHNPLIKELYSRLTNRGMHNGAAMGVCMHKILRIVYGMLKNGTAFDPEIDRKNQEKTPPKNHKSKTPKKRRLQEFDENAPISRRQHKKRKEQVPSQDESLVKHGILEPAPSS